MFVFLCIILMLSAKGYAENKWISFDIPSQNVNQALDSYVEHTNLSLVYSLEDLGEISSKKVSGQFSPVRALEIMLNGTGLVFTQTDNTTISIKKNHAIKSVDKQPEIGTTSTSQKNPTPVSTVSAGAEVDKSAPPQEGAAEKKAVPEDYVLEEIVVTATKTGETELQKTALAITAFSEENLRDSGVFMLQELGTFAPNVEFTHNTGTTVQGYIRGVGNPRFGISGGETNVAYYIDGVYLLRGQGILHEFFDLERVEVLRGPQGTLWGRNANGGAVNFITKRPSDQLEIKASAEFGNFSKRRFDATVSGPIVEDKVKVRLTLSDTESDGILKNITPTGNDPRSQDVTSMRASIEFMPSESINLRLSGDYSDSSNNGGAWKSRNSQGFSGLTVPQDFFEVNMDFPGNSEAENWGVAGFLDINLPRGMVLRSITAYRENKTSLMYEIDGSDNPAAASQVGGPGSTDQFQQEIQLNANWDRWKWILGGFYFHQESISDSAGALLPGGIYTYINNREEETDSYALFGDVRYAITDKMSANAGLRFSFDDKRLNAFTFAQYFGFIIVPPSFSEFSEKYEEWLPKFGVDYQFSDDLMAYVSIAKGYRPGGLEPANITVDPFIDAEFVWNYELGFKSEWFDNRLRANVALFYSDYQDMEVLYVVDSIGQTDNAAEAALKGVELEFLARPLKALTLNGAVSYLDATYEEFMTVVRGLTVPLDVSGNRLPYTPKWTFALGAQYVFTLGNFGFLTVRGDVSWKDQIYFDQYNEELFSQESYTLVNGLVRFETVDGRWSAELYATNLFEEEYMTYGQPSLNIGDVLNAPGNPRLYGFRLAFNY